MSSYPTRRRLDPQEQHTRLTMFFPGFRRTQRANPIIWEGTVRPIGGALYKIQIEYRAGHRPIVRVLEPPLRSREDGVRIPHTFKTGSICLHLIAEWTSSMYIHETIIPWTALWLYFYEVWLATGVWLGGGHEETSDDEQQPTGGE